MSGPRSVLRQEAFPPIGPRSSMSMNFLLPATKDEGLDLLAIEAFV